ncbi:hypothetical protein CES85_3735 (plasmid) [Ochrobactrum quorumnocens]|uniref:Uncharacterized protein n=1 Tax=Ochrobactrum quorumnocens TaxID=271865 RepID=A0A248UMM0_9HYPH|nr:hypothetical protein CES85_3735 [[Ochrobactrum] quorumnocens]
MFFSRGSGSADKEIVICLFRRSAWFMTIEGLAEIEDKASNPHRN